MSESVLARSAIDYPCSDGKPIAESQIHLACTLYAVDVLWNHYRDQADVYVGGDMFLYYEEGNPRVSVVPDVFVVLGAPKEVPGGGLRDTYKLWEEPKGPDFVLEVTSRSTRREDEGRKREVYASLGVGEYFLCDPRSEYLSPPVQGYRLRGDGYEPLPVTWLAHGVPGVRSEVLGLDLRLRGKELRLHDPATGQDLLTYQEQCDAREAAEAQVAEVVAAREAAEAQVAEVVAAREAAEAQVADLRARLRDLQDGPPPPDDSQC